MQRFHILHGPFELADVRGRLGSTQAGAYASFEGWVREHHDGRPVLGLTYDSYPSLAETEGNRVIAEAIAQFAIIDAACAHRVGRLELGELAVWVGVSAAHRDAAFAACRWIIDEIKSRVPIWKHEYYADGETAWLHPVADCKSGQHT